MVLRTLSPERKDVTGLWGKNLLNEELHNVYCSTGTIRLMEHNGDEIERANYKSTLERKGKQKINRQTERQSGPKFYNLEYNKKKSVSSVTQTIVR
jgi:hypothetical protein